MKYLVRVAILLLVLIPSACTREQTEVVTQAPGISQNSRGLSIFEVSLSAPSFNPSRQDKIECRYKLSRDALITVKIYDADRQLVRELLSANARKSGPNKETWDGKDVDGRVVPNEAYFFNIEARDSEDNNVVYDPMTFSGGESADLTEGQFDRASGTLSYKLSQPARVLLRAGIPGSALLKTVVDWKPRVAGEITEYWNGKDENNLIDVSTAPNHRLILTYMTLPETSVITVGNDQYEYPAYKRSLKSARPVKEERTMMNGRKLSPHFLKSRLTDRAFKVNLSFPELEMPGLKGIPLASQTVLVRAEVPNEDREVLVNQQYEIIIFVDSVFHAEEERGHLPFNYPLELKDFPPGEHIITINVITFGDQIGIGSKKIRVR